MKNGKIVKVPYGLTSEVSTQRILRLKGVTVLETCISELGTQGRMFLEDHLLLFVLSGTYRVRWGNRQVTVRKNEMVLLKRAMVVEYEKSGEDGEEHLLNYWMFFLSDDLLKEFAAISNSRPGEQREASPAPISIRPVSERLSRYLESIEPYFSEDRDIDDHLVKFKLLELLYGLGAADGHLMNQLLQLRHPVRMASIADIVETNITTPATLADLAYLSGRSLSSFKRDFYAIYQMPPYQWIRKRRIEKAKELLAHTLLPVTDICYSAGFENPAHFSRIFKQDTGYSPTSFRQMIQSKE
ncbi:HTH-type transcriptional activator Btr [compost metagenome]